jgi:hypothetical protein
VKFLNDPIMTLKSGLLLIPVFFIYSCNNPSQGTSEKESGKTVDTPVASVKAADAPAPAAYLNQLEYGKIKFIISSPQTATANTFTIVPSGFVMVNDTVKLDCEGTIVHSEVSDIDGDNEPELLIVSQSGDNKKSKAYLFSANKNKSMSMVGFPDFSSDPKKSAGYSGHDEFAFVEGSFVHRFPLYESGKPVNKTRQFQYKLKSGEAMKQLVLYKKIEY